MFPIDILQDIYPYEKEDSQGDKDILVDRTTQEATHERDEEPVAEPR